MAQLQVSTTQSYQGQLSDPRAVVCKRKMAPGIADIEGSTHGHDVIPVESAIKYLEARGYPNFIDLLKEIKGVSEPYLYIGSSKERGANRVVFGEAVNLVLDGLSKEEAAKKVMVIDSMSLVVSKFDQG